MVIQKQHQHGKSEKWQNISNEDWKIIITTANSILTTTTIEFANEVYTQRYDIENRWTTYTTLQSNWACNKYRGSKIVSRNCSCEELSFFERQRKREKTHSYTSALSVAECIKSKFLILNTDSKKLFSKSNMYLFLFWIVSILIIIHFTHRSFSVQHEMPLTFRFASVELYGYRVSTLARGIYLLFCCFCCNWIFRSKKALHFDYNSTFLLHWIPFFENTCVVVCPVPR